MASRSRERAGLRLRRLPRHPRRPARRLPAPSPHRRVRAAVASTSPTPTSRSAGTHMCGRQLPRLQHLRHRERATSRSCSPRWSARAARATSRSTATCCSCRWSRRAAASTAACRASPTPVSKERFRGVRIFDISDLTQADAGGGGADLPRLAHAHAGAGPERQARHLHLRLGHRLGALGRGARRLLGRASRTRTTRTRRSSAST